MNNLAGKQCDAECVAELSEAGINFVRHDELVPHSEPITHITGTLHGWTFKRAWYYWSANGPALPFEYADPLHEAHGRDVRVSGHCGCPSPREWIKHGNGVDSYHIDTQEGLNALAQAIREWTANGRY